jgi:hypothetical protein
VIDLTPIDGTRRGPRDHGRSAAAFQFEPALVGEHSIGERHRVEVHPEIGRYELDVEGILAFAERVLPRAADLWVQASLDQRQRFQQLFFPDGIAFDGNRLIGTGATAPVFSYLGEIETGRKVWWTRGDSNP